MIFRPLEIRSGYGLPPVGLEHGGPMVTRDAKLSQWRCVDELDGSLVRYRPVDLSRSAFLVVPSAGCISGGNPGLGDGL